MKNTNESVCDSEGRHEIEGLEAYLEEFQGQSVSVEQCGCVSHTRWWNVFESWVEYGKLIFSSSDEEDCWFVDIRAVLSWAIDFLSDSVDIIMNNGTVLAIHKN
jgi:hypothetical protein